MDNLIYLLYRCTDRHHNTFGDKTMWDVQEIKKGGGKKP